MGRPHRSADKCHYSSEVKRVNLLQHVCWHLIGSVYCLCQADWTISLTVLRPFPFSEAVNSLFYKRSGTYGRSARGHFSRIMLLSVSYEHTCIPTERADETTSDPIRQFWNESSTILWTWWWSISPPRLGNGSRQAKQQLPWSCLRRRDGRPVGFGDWRLGTVKDDGSSTRAFKIKNVTRGRLRSERVRLILSGKNNCSVSHSSQRLSRWKWVNK